MPSIFTPIPSETERKAPGTGGKPPVDRRPTGGGGGGGDDDWKTRARPARDALPHPRLCLLRPRRRHDVLCRAGGAVLRAPGRHPHGPRTLRQIGDWHPVLLPPILFLKPQSYCSAASPWNWRAGISSAKSMSSKNGWGWGGRRCAAHCPGSRHSGVWGCVSHRPVLAWRQLTAQGFAFDQLGDAGKLFLLSHHRTARRPSSARRPGADCLPLRSRGSARRIPPDRRGRNRMVLAHHGLRLAGSYLRFWCWVNNGSG